MFIVRILLRLEEEEKQYEKWVLFNFEVTTSGDAHTKKKSQLPLLSPTDSVSSHHICAKKCASLDYDIQMFAFNI